ncbi:MAG: LacI family DNA-binding transcriptional regulator [Lentisphaeria bacterium]|nr:LacI family DNA-binding transcriptional regulator [Lentisphaeria bacterium]
MASYPTLKDVSAAAGVSMALVSVVLNGKKSRIMASPATRERILKAAAELGYEPDRNARGLRMSRSFLIGVLAYEINSSFVPEIVTGIEQKLVHSNYNILLGSYHNEAELSERLEMFRKRKVDALIIICGAAGSVPELLAGFEAVPKVLVGTQLDIPNCACVFSDRRVIGQLAAQSLYERGHRRTGYLMNYNCDGSGWLDAWRNFPDADEPVTVECRNFFSEGEAAVRKLLTAHPEITAVFADSDILAAAAIKCAVAMGRRVPEDLAVLGTDDSSICQLTTPALSSIRQLKRERGNIAVEMVLDMLENKKCENVALPGELILRESL